MDDTQRKAEFLPCPFCGGTDIRTDLRPGAGTGIWHRGEDVYSMCCYDCGATFPNRYKRELLIEAWNRRAAAPQASALPLPEGWQAVPIEPTYEMCIVDWDVSMSDAHTADGVSRCAWRAMLSAAPLLVQPEGGE